MGYIAQFQLGFSVYSSIKKKKKKSFSDFELLKFLAYQENYRSQNCLMLLLVSL